MQFEHAPPEALQLLQTRIRDLDLSLERSPVAGLVRHLHAELQEKGLRHFRPKVYLSDEWGSPTGEPVIGIPFYLGDPRVANLEDAINDIEDEREIMMYLRHEAGHAFNHAYELYRTSEWRKLFGNTRQPYRDDYRFVPFSRDFVRYIPGWYAQKHPDEDFAETFAVWLDPTSLWESRYDGWGAMRKLKYVDRMARELGDVTPPKSVGKTDITVAEMEQTVEEFYRELHVDESPMIADLALDADLLDIFPPPTGDEETRSAALLLREHRRTVIDKVNYWTGVRRTLVRTLVIAIEERLTELALVSVRKEARKQMVELTVYITTLAMTFLVGKKRLKHRRPAR
ncbi:MAG TPA: putative zinc-binding metallopeptidase [Thermoanaerobaculia bacterium]|jgi:hypothetical protein|nr:putative zinc-binding metallopeptidase [Thermoanaerobaculia bacterium]